MSDPAARGEAAPELGLVVGGGGARSAYQAGVLRGLAERLPQLRAPILTGVSAGAINAAHLGNHQGTFREAADDLVDLWRSIDVDQVFETRTGRLLGRMARVASRLGIGWPGRQGTFSGMVDTRPLRRFLCEALEATPDGGLPGVRANVAAGRLRALAVLATRYATGQTVTFFDGRDIEAWERPQRRSERTRMRVDHVMASASLPFFFPSVEVDGAWYGDGGIRLVAPLAPAIHLGASRLLIISTRYRRSRREADVEAFEGPPTVADIGGVVYNAIFLDQIEHDEHQMRRINDLLAAVPPEARGDLRIVDMVTIRPSRDIGRLASTFELRLPRTFRYLMRRLGSREAESQDFLSTVMFQRDYVQALIELGEEDGRRRADDVEALLSS